jgi:hypothetical protein
MIIPNVQDIYHPADDFIKMDLNVIILTEINIIVVTQPEIASMLSPAS